MATVNRTVVHRVLEILQYIPEEKPGITAHFLALVTLVMQTGPCLAAVLWEAPQFISMRVFIVIMLSMSINVSRVRTFYSKILFIKR